MSNPDVRLFWLLSGSLAVFVSAAFLWGPWGLVFTIGVWALIGVALDVMIRERSAR